ncbi:MAG: flagellar brake protein, partial [Paenibacillus macerans]|nr:flagellar brake protein [Paenibacillus macerans]
MFPKVNDLVYIQVASTDKQYTDKECKSRIADVEEESFLIEVPIESGSGRIKKLYIGDELSIYFLTDDGVKNYFNTY